MTLPTPTPLTDEDHDFIVRQRVNCYKQFTTRAETVKNFLSITDRLLATITSLQSDLAQARSMAIAAGEYQLAAESDLRRTREELAWRLIEDAPDWLVRMAKNNPPRIAELVVKNFNFEGNQFASVYWDQDKCAPTYFMLREFPPTPPTGT